MSPRSKGKTKIPSDSKTAPSLPVLPPHAAGIDIGAREICVAVPPGRDPKPVRAFATFTDDLHGLRDWLQACGVTAVAMESTSVYWIPLFQILEAAGIEVCLVNARHYKNLPGRKTDVQDCQWLQYLHAVGLLRGSFRPPETVCAVRSLLRLRDGLVRAAATCVHRLHKALTQMNIQLQHVIADVTGVTGLAILEAILAGERDPVALAKLKDGRIRASTDTIAKSLRGDWRAEHLFTLRQCPDNRITGGKIMSSSTRDVQSRAATALRLAAQGLNQSQNYFGDLYRRWKARLGTPKAITAMAHKLARILWHLFKYREAFNPEVFRQAEEKIQRKKLARRHNTAAALGLKLVSAQ